MNICGYNHSEIVHDERKCPLCECIDEISRLQNDLISAEKAIEKLQEQDA